MESMVALAEHTALTHAKDLLRVEHLAVLWHAAACAKRNGESIEQA
jgi:hypothetical protein